MHSLKPNTRYKLINITLAIEETYDDSEISDGLNNILNDQLGFISDWSIDYDGPVLNTDENPEEGDLFII